MRSILNPRYLYGSLNETSHRLIEWDGWSHRGWNAVLLLFSATFYWICISVPMDLTWQALFAVGVFGVASYLRRYAGTLVTLVMMMLSICVSSRYLYWRVFYTIDYGGGIIDVFFSCLLFGAELYAWMVLLLGYLQTAWPLRRKPLDLPADTSLWPTVDIFIPTYNEPLSVVKPTVLAALSIDWPKDKLAIYILDDQRREVFREFAEMVGVTHITRPANQHAKAGNINEALPKTSGEYIAFFDCDHVPTRSFLQTTMGWFLHDPKLALMQTPHHFLSPDPFERNLDNFRTVPNEGELFYGLIQDGNDLWNAAFFCGSCAVIRRTTLIEVGGVAVDTVTEDAHTALKMQRLGYNTAYLAFSQAAGLATESLSAHVGQRIRWARGMAQIFRTDNPMFGKGLSFGQRLCYTNAMMHFFYGLPRMIFLLAPLSYMYFQVHIIQASALMIASYSVPHLLHANVTNSRIQGGHRHSFWAEVYEATLAWYIFRPTLVALINPKEGSFNVTAKGGLVEQEHFDWTISRPYLVMLALNILGLLIGFGRLFWWNTFESGTVVLNLIWTVYNLIILGATLAVATESKQIRKTHRVRAKLKATITLPDGHVITCMTENFSMGGMSLRLPDVFPIEAGMHVHISLFGSDREFMFPANVVSMRNSLVSLVYPDLTLEQEIDMVRCTMGRADAWISWSDDRDVDRPLKGFMEIFTHSVHGFAKFGTGGIYVAWKKFTSAAKVPRFFSSFKSKSTVVDGSPLN